MEEPAVLGEMIEPRFMREGYDFNKDSYLGEDGRLHLRDDAPEWAKKEFEEFNAMVNPIPDEDGRIIQG